MKPEDISKITRALQEHLEVVVREEARRHTEEVLYRYLRVEMESHISEAIRKQIRDRVFINVEVGTK